MVQKIRFMNHVIQLFGMTPTTSRAIPECCPTCGLFYNDGSHRKCYYLCCEYIDCLDCVLNQNKFSCPVFDDDLTAYMRRKRKRVRQAVSPSSSLKGTMGSMISRIEEKITTTTTTTQIFNENEEEMLTDVQSNNEEDFNINVGTEQLMDSNNNETDKDQFSFDEMEMRKDTKIERTEEIINCNEVKDLKPQIEFLLPKHHWNCVVVLEHVNGGSNSGLGKKRKRCRNRFDLTAVQPRRMSGRIRSAKKTEVEAVMPA